jgi:protocatechuate 3,4-dioxygenase alpha subunit
VTTARSWPPPQLTLPDGRVQAPYVNVTIFARGLLAQAQTRLYFPDETAANAADPILAKVPTARRQTLLAHEQNDGVLRFDIRLQGENETVFFSF